MATGFIPSPLVIYPPLVTGSRELHAVPYMEAEAIN